MARRARAARLDAALRVVATLAGTLPAAVLAGVCLARFLPFAEPTRFTIGFTLTLPLWVAAMCLVSVVPSAVRAWAWCLGAALVLAAFAYLVPA